MEYLYSIEDGIKRYHYVYRITNIVNNKHYYGKRSTPKQKERYPLDDLGIIYFSSSTDKDFKLDQQQNPQNYKYKIIKTFSTKNDAVDFEVHLHKKFNVKLHEKFYNKANQTSSGCDITGIPRPKHVVEGMRERRKDVVWIYNHETSTRKLISSSELDYYIARGFEKGVFRDESTIKLLHEANCQYCTIYDKNNNIMFDGKIQVAKTFCKEIKLPYRQVRESYIKNIKIYSDVVNIRVISRLKGSGRDKFIDWYATNRLNE